MGADLVDVKGALATLAALAAFSALALSSNSRLVGGSGGSAAISRAGGNFLRAPISVSIEHSDGALVTEDAP